MATVPLYGPQKETTAPVRLPRINPGAAAEGARATGEIGNALTNVSSATAKIALDMQNRTNTDEVMRAEGALVKAESDKQTEIQQRQGVKAKGAAKDMTTWWGETAPKLSDSLTNDAQRRAFNQFVTQRQPVSVGTASKHEAIQLRQSLLDSQQASINSATDSAVASRADPNAVAANRLQILNSIRAVGVTEGWTPEILKAKADDALNKLHASVISAFLDGDNNPEAARAYYNLHKDELTGGVRTDVEKKLHVGELRTESQNATEAILTKNDNEISAIDAAKKAYTGDMQDAVVVRIKDHFSTLHAAQSAQDKANSDTAWKHFVQGGNKTDAIPPTLWAQLPGTVQENLQRAQKADGNPVTNNATYYKLSQMPFDDLAKENLMKYVGSLSQADFQRFANLQQAIKSGQKDPNKNIDMLDAQTLQQQLGNVHHQMGWGSSDKEKAGQFDATAGKMIESMQRDLGRRLTQNERQGVIDELLMKGEIPSGHWYWPDPNKTFYEVLGTPDQANFVPEGVPFAEAAKIKEALQRNNLPATPDRIQYYYNLKNQPQ